MASLAAKLGTLCAPAASNLHFSSPADRNLLLPSPVARNLHLRPVARNLHLRFRSPGARNLRLCFPSPAARALPFPRPPPMVICFPPTLICSPAIFASSALTLICVGPEIASNTSDHQKDGASNTPDDQKDGTWKLPNSLVVMCVLAFIVYQPKKLLQLLDYIGDFVLKIEQIKLIKLIKLIVILFGIFHGLQQITGNIRDQLKQEGPNGRAAIFKVIKSADDNTSAPSGDS